MSEAKAQPADPPLEGDAAPKKKLAGKTLVLFIILPALLILGGGGAAAMLLLGGGKEKAEAHASADHGEKKAKADKHAKKKDEKKKDGHGKDDKKGGHGEKDATAAAKVTEGDGVYYVTLPDILVNIGSADGGAAFLKLRLTIEAPDEDVVGVLKPNLPRITDQFQSFLRELRVDDLAGSAGAYRLRLELLRRVNLVAAPAQANAVLIEEMLVQ